MPKIIQYRNKCIGCCICVEMQPNFWRMSKKDGKATLLSAKEKKGKFILSIPQNSVDRSIEVGNACPVKIIKVNS